MGTEVAGREGDAVSPSGACLLHQWDVASALQRAQGKHAAGDALPKLWPMLGFM